MNHENFKKLLSTHAVEVNFWKDTVIGALPHLDILQSAYQKWSSLSKEIKVKVEEASYSELKYSEARTLKSLTSLKYKRFAVIFAHAFDCWDVMQETFGACGSDSTEMNWNLSLEHDALKAIDELEHFIDNNTGGFQKRLELTLQAVKKKQELTLQALKKKKLQHSPLSESTSSANTPQEMGYQKLSQQETVSKTRKRTDSSSNSEGEDLSAFKDSNNFIRII